jgi:hypothetical protein
LFIYKHQKRSLIFHADTGYFNPPLEHWTPKMSVPESLDCSPEGILNLGEAIAAHFRGGRSEYTKVFKIHLFVGNLGVPVRHQIMLESIMCAHVQCMLENQSYIHKDNQYINKGRLKPTYTNKEFPYALAEKVVETFQKIHPVWAAFTEQATLVNHPLSEDKALPEEDLDWQIVLEV